MTKSHAMPLVFYLQADTNWIFQINIHFGKGAAKMSDVKVEGWENKNEVNSFWDRELRIITIMIRLFLDYYYIIIRLLLDY